MREIPSPAWRIIRLGDLSARDQELIHKAGAARKNSYSPYSHFSVGAAVRTKSGAIHVGTNMENSSYGVTVCAEVTALGSAVAAGDFEATQIAVIGGPHHTPESSGAEPITPCGRCRQLILEAAHVAGGDVEIFCCSPDLQKIAVTSISALLPHGFGPRSLPATE